MRYVDFKTIKAAVSIEDAANLLKLPLKKNGNQLRSNCPACGNEHERIVVITRLADYFTASTRRWTRSAHNRTGRTDAAAFLSPTGAAHNSPAPEQKNAAATKKESAFDPVAFAAKLTFTDEVAELGISEEDATRLQIGFARGKVYIVLRDEFGFTAGFVAFADGALKIPPKLLANSSVVKLKRA